MKLARWMIAAAMLGPALAGQTVDASAQQGASARVQVLTDDSGSVLQVGGRDFMVFGMNWGYVPIGNNYSYSLWSKPDWLIEEALAREMPLLKNMGVNVIRHYVGIPPRWVKYIYEKYGIWTVVNHPMARYGFTIDGVWVPNVDYSDPRLREAVKAEILALVDEFRDTPGMLMWLLGNENNYGLSWTTFEIEALPEGERDAARARYLYSLFGEIITAIKARDPNRPVAIANGDVQYIDIIAEECKDLDIFGTNVYRGVSARDLFDVVKAKLGIPVMFTEFGADAFNAKTMREDQVMQCYYLLGQWQEIYEQSRGKGRAGNAIGGMIFEWSDGWWKYRQEERLDIHDTNASWPNGGYLDFVEGENNMNEEWWGITAKGPPDKNGLYEVYPRAAYYALQEAFKLDPYASTTDLTTIRNHFRAILPTAAALDARSDRASMLADEVEKVRVSNLRMEFETYSTGGKNITTPHPPDEVAQPGLPSFLGFDHLQSFYVDFAVNPAPNVKGNLSINILGNVPLNPIDEIFYENRGIRQTVISDDGTPIRLQGLERVKVYGASVLWDEPWFQLEGFYRTGHTHWGYEGDFFGIYREAFYGENIDIYNADVPIGVMMSGKRFFKDFKIAFGPELFWGANPSILLKYTREVGRFTFTGVYQDEFSETVETTSSLAIPEPPTRRASLYVKTNMGLLGVELGGLWAGSTKIDEQFAVADPLPGGGYRLLADTVRDKDTFGVKGKLTFQKGRFNWYGQAAYMGIVADGGPPAIQNYTGWYLKDSGMYNQANVMTGLAFTFWRFQLGPNVLYQKPLVGPIPGGLLVPPRNVREAPFVVRANRETAAVELMLTFDPTPATWLWQWDNDAREDARFAFSLGGIFRHHPTTMDAAIAFTEDGDPFAFPGATPPRDLWEANLRVVSAFRPNARLLAHAYAGQGEPNGDDPRLIERYGGDARLTWGPLAFEAFAKFDDWGPYDYHRDFNNTFPVQLMGDVSYSLGIPRWFGFPHTRAGVRGTWRSLDQYSPRYDPDVPGEKGTEWEIRTYMHVSL